MDTQKHIDKQLLLDYFSGTLAPAQKQEVESWIQESEENKKMARDIEYIYFATDTLNTIKISGLYPGIGRSEGED